MYLVSSSTVFFFVTYMHVHVPLFVVVFQEMNCCSSDHGLSSLHQVFMFVSAPVSEIRKLNRNN